MKDSNSAETTTQPPLPPREGRLEKAINWALLILIVGGALYLYFSGQLVRVEYVEVCTQQLNNTIGYLP